jgi:translocation and assembly module TamA
MKADRATRRRWNTCSLAGMLLMAVFWTWPGYAQEGTATGGVKYKVEIEGAPNAASDLIKESSQLLLLRERLPPTLAALGRRATEDEGRFRAVLESEGYYNATVKAGIERDGGEAVVRMEIAPGERYRVASIKLEIEDARSETAAAEQESHKPLAKLNGRPVRAADVITTEDEALAAFRNHGFPFTARGDRHIEIDHAAHTVAVSLPVKLGPAAVFGETHFSGLDRVRDSFMARSVPWKRGAPFDLSQLEEFRKRLVETTVFASVKVAPLGATDMANGAPLDVIVTTTEGAPRTISLGGSYARDKGFGASAIWTHRNFFGDGEKLELSLDATQLDQTAAAALSKPNFLRRDQTLKTAVQGKHADTDAYEEWSGNVSAGLERRLSELWTVGAAVEVEVAELTQNNISNRSYLTGLPLSVTRAPRDIILDQRSGWRFRATATPYGGYFGTAVTFFKTEAEAGVYVPMDVRERIVLAGRLKVGTIVGATTFSVPANKRLYAGGGGSVRGFGYQLVGPLAADGTPTGGRSLLEAGAEGRFRITETIGVVPFIDTGAVSRSSLPGDSARFSVGAGIGARYYTSLGPFRLDLAVPVNPRPGVDKGFQFYLSFGQAF